MVYVAGVALAGVCVLGLYLGIQPALERASDANQAAASSTAPTPGMAAAVVRAGILCADPARPGQQEKVVRRR